MRLKIHIILLNIALVLLHLSPAYAQPAADARAMESDYSILRTSYESAQWDSAFVQSNRFLSTYPQSPHESSARFILARSALNKRIIGTAILEAKLLMIKFPESNYIDDAHWLLAEAALMSERWDNAQKELDWIVNKASDEELVIAAKERQSELTAFLMTREVLNRRQPQDSVVYGRVGLILPLTGAMADEANAFLRGFQARWTLDNFGEVLTYNSNDDLDLMMNPDRRLALVFDSEDDPVKAVRLSRRLVVEHKVWTVVGGMTSSEAAALAAESEINSVPFLTTMCGVDGLTNIGKNTFQGRPNYRIIGENLAKFGLIPDTTSFSQVLPIAPPVPSIVIDTIPTFAMLVPLTLEGKQIASGFKEHILSHGGEILVEEVYYPETQDFSAQMKSIRKIALRKMYNDSLRAYYDLHGHIICDSMRFKPTTEQLEPLLADSLEEIGEDTKWRLSTYLLDSLWEADHKKLRKWMTETGKEIDSIEIPLSVYDGLLFVIEPGKIESAAPQFARFNFGTRLLGGENWMNPESMARVKNYIEGMVFAEPFAPVEDDEYYNFSRLININDNEPLNRFHLAGERAAKIVGNAMNGIDNAQKMRQSLSQIHELNTLSGKVSFLQEERIDRGIGLLKYSNGTISRVSDGAQVVSPSQQP